MGATIKVKAYAVLLNSSRTRHAVWVGEDSTKDPSSFHRLLGGHVEFGERATEAVVREIAEELGTQLTAVRSLGVVESFFVHEGEPGHEVAFIYGGTISESTVHPEGGWFYDGGPIRVEWRPVAGDAAVPLYPEGTQDLIDEWIVELSRREVPEPLEG